MCIFLFWCTRQLEIGSRTTTILLYDRHVYIFIDDKKSMLIYVFLTLSNNTVSSKRKIYFLKFTWYINGWFVSWLNIIKQQTIHAPARLAR